MPYGQLVIGPPGSGKTTYCHGMQQFLSTACKRKVMVVNLDPANDSLPYQCDINISSLVTVEDTMKLLKLGPNGGLIYCMEYLEKNIDWLEDQLSKFSDCYFLFDCPGQVELYTHHKAVRSIVERLQQLDFKLVAVHLVDSHYCTDPSKFLSILLTSLSTMLQIELPHVNILSKIDLIESYGKLAFGLDFYTEVLNLDYLLERMNEDAFSKKYRKLSAALAGLIENYSLVWFATLNIQDKESVANVVKIIDKANGYIFNKADHNIAALMSSAVGADFDYFKYPLIESNIILN
ncbi:GPN-loop GTPase 2 [Trichoplax sp. H2]|nr:GPN-loop GTPase 2 [Trichoplax sp. H2]|eukprot:RDD39224.1 GPN-loop GTPase 2 [Trichoplax sp. H2]